MNRFCTLAPLIPTLLASACATTDPTINTTARFEENPLSQYQNPTIKQEVSHNYVSNRDALRSVAKRIEADAEAAAAIAENEDDEEEAL